MHEKYEKYIFSIIFYVSLITNDKQTKKGKEINIFKSLSKELKLKVRRSGGN
jgi:hypothetical protein